MITLSVTGALNAVLSEEHKKEMCRYLYNHQARMLFDISRVAYYHNSFSIILMIFVAY